MQPSSVEGPANSGWRRLRLVSLELLARAVELDQEGTQVLARLGEGVGAAGGEPRLLLTIDEALPP